MLMNRLNNIFSSKDRNLTEGSIWKTLLILSLPIILSNMFQTFYNMADAFWLGKLGKTALAAPTITFNVVFTIIALAGGLAMGGTTLVGQYKGAKDEKMVNRAAGNTYSMIFIIAVILAAIGFMFSPLILRLLQTPAEAYSDTLVYMRITFIGMPFVFGYFIFQGILQGYGNTISPMKLNAFTVILNIILDPLLIFGWGPFPAMGVAGAGIATVFSQFTASMIGTIHLFSGRYGVKISLKTMMPDRQIIKNILRIGLPISIGQTGTSFGFTILMGIVNTLGTATVGAFGIGNRIISLLVMPAMGLARGNSIMVAQNIGADKVKRAERTVWTSVAINSVILFILTTLLFFFGGYVVKFFINDPEVIRIGTQMFRITAYSVLFFSIMIVFNGAFQGSGHTMPVFALQLARLWLFRLPFAYLFTKIMDMGYNGIFWAMFISNSVIAVASFIWFSRGTWKERIIHKEPVETEDIIVSVSD